MVKKFPLELRYPIPAMLSRQIIELWIEKGAISASLLGKSVVISKYVATLKIKWIKETDGVSACRLFDGRKSLRSGSGNMEQC